MHEAQQAGRRAPTPSPARCAPSSSSTPSRSRRSAPRRRRALDLGEVLLLDAVARVREPVGQLAVVGEQQQPLGVGVEPADREHAGLGRDEVDDGGSAVGVLGRRHDTGRLVQEVVDEVGARATTAPSTSRTSTSAIDARADLGDLAVHPHPALADQLLAHPPAGHAGGGEHLLQLLGRRSGQLLGAQPLLELLDDRRRRGRTGRAAGGRRASRARASRGTTATCRTARPGPGPGRGRSPRCSRACSRVRTTPSTLTPRMAAIWARLIGCL